MDCLGCVENYKDNKEKIKPGIFGMISDKSKLYCREHVFPGFYDVSVMCIENNCPSLRSYGFKNEKPLYCSKDRKKGMISLTHKICDVEECNTRASFGLSNGPKTKCKKHEYLLVGDKIISSKIKTCIMNDCIKEAIYTHKSCVNNPDKSIRSPSFCTDHVPDNYMIGKRFCLHSYCDKPKYIGEFCRKHQRKRKPDHLDDLPYKKATLAY